MNDQIDTVQCLNITVFDQGHGQDHDQGYAQGHTVIIDINLHNQ